MARVGRGRLRNSAAIGRAVERAIRKFKVQRLLAVEIGPGRLAVGCDE
jgi:hypothetical protein